MRRDKLLRRRTTERVHALLAQTDPPTSLAPAPAPVPWRAAGLVVGINACTRALERGQLRLVVVARDIQPLLLVQARMAGVPRPPLHAH
jgi:hypothetical protein